MIPPPRPSDCLLLNGDLCSNTLDNQWVPSSYPFAQLKLNFIPVYPLVSSLQGIASVPCCDPSICAVHHQGVRIPFRLVMKLFNTILHYLWHSLLVQLSEWTFSEIYVFHRERRSRGPT